MPATGVFLAMLVVSFLIAAFASTSAALIVVAILVLTLASQGVGVLNQTRLFEVSHEARSRLNTAFVTNNFIGGAIGSTLATVLWARGGWVSVSVAGVILSVLCLLIWAVGRRGPLLVGDEGAQT